MRLSDLLVQMIFGWPMIVVSILLSVIGAGLKKPAFLVAAGIIGIPFAAYITAASQLPGLLLPAFQLGAAYSVKRQKFLLAWLLITPMIVVAAWLAYAVLSQ
jgi:hypothetical protein